MGIAPDGEVAHNGMDHWWDDQGDGNCWEDNTYSRGERTDNFTIDPAACADGGSSFTPGRPGQGRRLPLLQPVRPQRPDLAAPARAASGSTARPSPTSPGAAAGAERQQEAEALLARAAAGVTGLLLLLVGLGRRRRARCCVGPLLALALVVALVAAGGVAVARSTPALRGVRADLGHRDRGHQRLPDRRPDRFGRSGTTTRGTLRYTFRVTNDGRLPLTVLGLAGDQPEPRLFTLDGLSGPDGTGDVRLGAGETGHLTLALGMSGCETLSARAGSFVTQVVVRTEQAGVFDDDVDDHAA